MMGRVDELEPLRRFVIPLRGRGTTSLLRDTPPWVGDHPVASRHPSTGGEPACDFFSTQWCGGGAGEVRGECGGSAGGVRGECGGRGAMRVRGRAARGLWRGSLTARRVENHPVASRHPSTGGEPLRCFVIPLCGWGTTSLLCEDGLRSHMEGGGTTPLLRDTHQEVEDHPVASRHPSTGGEPLRCFVIPLCGWGTTSLLCEDGLCSHPEGGDLLAGFGVDS